MFYIPISTHSPKGSGYIVSGEGLKYADKWTYMNASSSSFSVSHAQCNKTLLRLERVWKIVLFISTLLLPLVFKTLGAYKIVLIEFHRLCIFLHNDFCLRTVQGSPHLYSSQTARLSIHRVWGDVGHVPLKFRRMSCLSTSGHASHCLSHVSSGQ